MSYLVFIPSGILLVACGFLFYRIFALEKKLQSILGGSKAPEDFQQNVLRKIMRLEAGQEELAPKAKILEAISHVAVQKVGFLRFNPFEDTGGDNSFALVLLDRDNNGVLISSLYARGGVRMYGKSIERGVSKHQLSEEEKQILEETIAKGIRN